MRKLLASRPTDNFVRDLDGAGRQPIHAAPEAIQAELVLGSYLRRARSSLGGVTGICAVDPVDAILDPWQPALCSRVGALDGARVVERP
jgi:hypothetical protein